MRHWLWLPVLSLACGPKTPPAPAAPLVGWVQQDGWAGSCYFPQNFDEIGGGAKRIARSEAITAVFQQWRGEKDSFVRFDDTIVMAAETTILGNPDKVEWVAAENAEQCADAMRRGGDMSRWNSWFREAVPRMQEGLCPYSPLDYTVYDYLSITTGWQFDRRVCEGDEFDVSASVIDFYKLSADGPWITAEGDTSQSAVGTDLPCNLETCYPGQVIMRFKGDDGYETIVPVGSGASFTAPGHGQVWVQINDDSWSDNTFKVEAGMQHHTSIEYDGEN